MTTTTTTANTTSTTATLHYTTLITLLYSAVHYSTLHYTTLHYTTLTTPHHNYNCNYNYDYTHTLITLHYSYRSTTVRYNYNYNCATPHYIKQWWVRWPLQPSRPLQKTHLPPPFGPSVDSLCHSWFTTTNLSYRFPTFETSATALCSTTGNIISKNT